MTRELFFKLYHDAQDQPDPDMYISEYGYPDYFDEIADNSDDVIKILREIHQAANMTLRDVITSSHMTIVAFAKYFDVPLRTIEDWLSGSRTCRDYVKLLMMESLNMLPL